MHGSAACCGPSDADHDVTHTKGLGDGCAWNWWEVTGVCGLRCGAQERDSYRTAGGGDEDASTVTSDCGRSV
eukprot:6769419-Pyramimonas_sp.AAC.2